MKDQPMLSMWFGNFFEPFYSNFEATRKGITEVAEFGFNSINLDSKPWEDFFARYRGEEASQYVAMHEFMMAEAAKLGLDYTHLALYLCGDNLYPTIRDVPPVRGEEAILPNGERMGTYKYWSPIAQKTMVDHVKGLLRLYSDGMRKNDEGKIIMQTMFEPIPKPSFDEEGRSRYLNWLEKRFDISHINERYQLKKQSFEELTPDEYWLRPEELNWVNCAKPTAADFADRTGDFWKWIDNQTYLAEELQTYLATMKRHWDGLETPIFAEPVLHQWGYFFNPPNQEGWQTGQRAIDIYQAGQHVDGVLFIASPLNAENRADAYALSVEGSILRGANNEKSFTAGLYLGRHVNGDIYNVVPPAEAIATHIANGAKRLHCYGYSGLDDGGVLFRMDEIFKESLKTGIHWAAEVIPLLSKARTKEVALLFPAEMSLFEPLEVDENGRHRMDLLGWFQQFRDLGYHVDILHPDQIVSGKLVNYKYLVVPHNSLYDLGDNQNLEKAVKEFVENGGSIFHGPHCELVNKDFGIEEETIEFDCIRATEEIIPHGWSTVTFLHGESLGNYIQTGKTAIARASFGKGFVYSFGFQYGYSYSRKTMPIVPPAYGKLEMHPIVLLKETPIAEIVGQSKEIPVAPIKGVEFARFGKFLVVVNHRSSPIDIREIKIKQEIAQIPSATGWLAGHSATCLELAD